MTLRAVAYMPRVLFPAVAAALLAGLSIVPVSAAPPDGACPRPFTEATYEEMLFETFPEVTEAYGEETMRAVLVGYDNNANGTVCWIRHPSQSRVYESQLFVANVIDDNAVGLAR